MTEEIQTDYPMDNGDNPRNTNIVQPILQDMLKLCKFGTDNFVHQRLRALTNLQQVLCENMEWTRDAAVKLEELEVALDHGFKLIPPLVESWSSMAKFFSQLNKQCNDAENPTPNLNCLKHPSPAINHRAYADLVCQMISLCQQAERQIRLLEIMYGGLDEAVVNMQKKLQETVNNLRYFYEVCEKLKQDDQNLLKLFGDNQHDVSVFLEGWMKGGNELNLPVVDTCLPVVDMDIDINRISSDELVNGVEQDSKFSPAEPVHGVQPDSALSPVPTSTLSPDTKQEVDDLGRQETRVPQRRSRKAQLSSATPTDSDDTLVALHLDNPPKRGEKPKIKNVEDLVSRYQELQGNIAQELTHIKKHNEVLTSTERAFTDVPFCVPRSS